MNAPGNNPDIQRQVDPDYRDRKPDGFPKAFQKDRTEGAKEKKRQQNRMVQPLRRQRVLDDVLRGVRR
ncbi:MAG: hypothetical protein JF613_02500 [Acidobacteria bacterium]|nr:hypothetical protein [Acidobacteriota bacterium]